MVLECAERVETTALIRIDEKKKPTTLRDGFLTVISSSRTTDMADKGKNRETVSATIPLAYTVYEAEDGGKYMILQFMVNSTKYVASTMERKQKLDLRATTCKVFILSLWISMPF